MKEEEERRRKERDIALLWFWVFIAMETIYYILCTYF